MANGLKQITCAHCGKTAMKPLAPSRIKKGGGRFCSHKCYTDSMKGVKKSNRMADCHPDRPHYCKGMCVACYNNHKYHLHRDETLALLRKKWLNPEEKRKLQEKNHRYKINNPKVVSRRHGVPIEECEVALKINSCELCGSTWKLVVDHNHDTLRVRGRICGKCNSAIGMANDDPELMGRMAEYLKRESIYDSDRLFDLDAINEVEGL